jgi:hypothetical protein
MNFGVLIPHYASNIPLDNSALRRQHPLEEPAGGTVRCKVVINPKGKVSELVTGIQLCETVPWSQFRYQLRSSGATPSK